MSASRRLPRRPLRRRMAKAAFVLAAGVAPVWGAADSAAADSKGTDEALSDTVRIANTLLEEVGNEAAKSAMPVLMPAVNEVAQKTAHTSASLLGDVQRDFVNPEGLKRTLPSLDDPDLSAL
ncbi:hypothetical protein [Streptomyces sp. 6N223]|uniref:hypothetical protein n=1 Tax=Streptomyces sp. 6N223 TaxID=3457412 RepID=UPI003FD0B5B9